MNMKLAKILFLGSFLFLVGCSEYSSGNKIISNKIIVPSRFQFIYCGKILVPITIPPQFYLVSNDNYKIVVNQDEFDNIEFGTSINSNKWVKIN